MTNSKSTKRALVSSTLAILMCAAMLIGTTFAWFTDTASAGVNKIVSGNLKVDIIGADSEDHVEKLNFTKAATTDEEAGTEILWEPGCRYLTEGFRIANKGNLALKWKAQVNKGATEANEGNFDLLDVIDFYLVTKAADGTETATALDEFTGNLKKTETSEVYYIKGVMQTTAGNDYQGLTLDGITITVYVTQNTVESDSYDNQYDKDAQYLTYPAGVTKVSFPESVDYTTWTGASAKAPATAAYIDSNGEVQYVTDITDAIQAGATTVYLKEGTTANANMSSQTNRTTDITKDITIYANGANFEYGEIAINTTDAGKNANFTIKVYDAKNIRVWGNTPNAGVTQNIILENCTYEGTGIATGAAGGIFFAWGETGTINLTMNNCKVSGSDQGVYFGCDGSLTVKDSSFTECATGIKVSYKGTGTRTDRIENCVFTKCGCTTEMAGTSSYLAEDSAALKYKTSGKGSITLTLKGNTITGTLGDKGDTQFIGVTPVNE